MRKVETQERMIKEISRRQVTSVIREILADPDAGRVLSLQAQVRLKRSQRSESGGKVRVLKDVLRRYAR